VIYSFCAKENCADGNDAATSLVRDASGNLYGTTVAGGIQDANCIDGCGTIYRIAPDGSETVLYSFCSQANCADGFDPGGGLIIDPAGNLYGTTLFGGQQGCQNVGCGAIYRLGADGSYAVLYAFQGGSKGQWPIGELTADAAGNLYGSASGGVGLIFELTTAGVEKTLHKFCQTDCSDGHDPTGTLLLRDGFLYGTTFGGGMLGCNGQGCGVVYRVKAQ
jgi:uncharacterized repeat protein (TIGR03803 family)